MIALGAVGELGTIWLLLLGTMVALDEKTGRKVALAGLVALVMGFAFSEFIKELTMRPRPFFPFPTYACS